MPLSFTSTGWILPLKASLPNVLNRFTVNRPTCVAVLLDLKMSHNPAGSLIVTQQ